MSLDEQTAGTLAAQKTLGEGRAPRGVVVAALRSNEGKTTAALALILALKGLGLKVGVCKCGPDYVDPTLLAKAGAFGDVQNVSCVQGALSRDAPDAACCRNLDTWLMGREGVLRTYAHAGEGKDVVVVEGVMGLLDGKTGAGNLSGATLDVARILGLPVLLVVNARGLAQSVQILAKGTKEACEKEGVRLLGIFATNGGSPRHRAILETALDSADLPPLSFFLPRESRLSLPSRQLGLVPAAEVEDFEKTLDLLAQSLDAADAARFWDTLCEVSPEGPALLPEAAPISCKAQKRLAVARDAAFCFHYEENFRFLRERGWELCFFSPLKESCLPPCDALYLGGGYPEVFAGELEANRSLRGEIRQRASEGLPIFAECGGYMYLAKSLETEDGKTHAMCGVVDGIARMGRGLKSLGYREARFAGTLPFDLGEGLTLRGHEFHWSDMKLAQCPQALYETPDGKRHGVVTGPKNNVLASYLHVYLPSISFLNG